MTTLDASLKVRFSAEEREQIERRAAEERRSMGSLVRYATMRYLQGAEPDAGEHEPADASHQRA